MICAQFCEENVFEQKSHCLEHVFLKIKTPVPNSELRTIHIENLWTGKLDKNPQTNNVGDLNLIHKVFCKKCDHPIIGCRWYCTGCDEYNLCESCESSSGHPHHFIKIRFALPEERINPKLKFDLYKSSNANELISSSTSLRKPKIAETEKKATVSVSIRSITMHDVSQVFEIECESFFTPYSLSFFKEFPHTNNSFLFVAEKADQAIGGYIAFSIKKSRVQLVSIAVGSHSRRMGIAQQLITSMMNMCFEMGVNTIYLHVSVMNFPAQNLYKSFGFSPVKWINNYYQDEKEDALIMVNDNISCYLGKAPQKTEKPKPLTEIEESRCSIS